MVERMMLLLRLERIVMMRMGLMMRMRMRQSQQRMVFAGQSVELTIWELTEFLQAVGGRMVWGMVRVMGMSVDVAVAMAVTMTMPVGVGSLLLQLLDLQPAMSLGLLVAIASVDPAGAQQRSGAEEALGHQSIAGTTPLPEVYGRPFVQERYTCSSSSSSSVRRRRWSGIGSRRRCGAGGETQSQGQGTRHMDAGVVTAVEGSLRGVFRGHGRWGGGGRRGCGQHGAGAHAGGQAALAGGQGKVQAVVRTTAVALRGAAT